jgi:predicted RNase H-like HicB family nuclease
MNIWYKEQNWRRNEMKEFSVIIEKDEDGFFVASVPTLRGCHTQAKSLDTLMKRIKEAIELCLSHPSSQKIRV